MDVVNAVFFVGGTLALVGTVAYELWTTRKQLQLQEKQHELNMRRMFESVGLDYDEYKKKNPGK